MNSTRSTEPRIYVACLASYNAGKLHGKWIDANQEPDDIREEIAEMLKASPIAGAEEYAIHDSEGLGSISEHEGIDDVAELAALVDEHGDIFIGVYENFGDLEQAKTAMEENYEGCHKNLEEFAYELLEQDGSLNSMPENLRNYFDYEAYGRDLEMGGDVFTIETGHNEVHVFWNR